MAKSKSTLEDRFLAQWKQSFPKLPVPLRQYPIKNPATGRFWKLDFSWPEWRLMVEIQGTGRHQRLMGQAKDYERQNYLVGKGWRCLFLNTVNLRNMEEAVEMVAEVLCRARELPDEV